MNTTYDTPAVGRLWLPEATKVTFGRGMTVRHANKYVGIVTMQVRDAQGRKTQAGYGLGVLCGEGLAAKWAEEDALQRAYATPADMLAAMKYRARFGNRPLPSGIMHNERVINGGAMLGDIFFGNSLSPSNGTVNAPNRIALCNLNGFAAAAGDLSLGTVSGNVTTNEQTTHGLGRTGAVTPTSVVAQTTLDGNFSDQVVNTFTDSTATSTTYGTALVDNTTGAFNMFSEASYSSAVTNVGDTLLLTWSRSS